MSEPDVGMAVGLEVEYWVIDGEGHLCAGEEIVAAHDRIDHEFVAPMVEFETPPRSDLKAVRADLREVLEAGLAAAADAGKELVPLGTPLVSETMPAISDRGRLLERLYGEGVEYAKHCAGTHVHFDKRAVPDQINLLTALDPTLALVASSPYYDGRRLAHSSRAYVYRYETGRAFSRHRDLWEYADSMNEWNDRLTGAYEELRALAAERGIDDAEFERHVEPENSVLTPVRLRLGSPTVEWRAPDATLPSQLLALLADVTTAVSALEERSVEIGEPGIEDEAVVIPTFEGLRDLTREAIVEGRTPAIERYLGALGIDSGGYVPISETIDAGEHIDRERARELRLEYAARLREDVATL
ncbi:glutamate-cysteine ligase family protein [Halalkalicoccus jeotgali]|uniref:Glutamate--cysteine ligase GCS2 n=1 Tax=Halalkalicoccus jeotgali (strain DSM 18796 / CECT 7217 / JCM 14584 / KCTC 4019 / B3) TaxID=795797 RepID=D8J7Z9_HALJB|nr:glutamate-cysteine ligase family protein [Halalkalicoccus jeotgali]ADJ14112.1 glutamate--cysteine ligase GCS2 [Halalkalicoccus jeotgali B3]ELY34706.1 glutamate--cysteine ligase GCS2 [Halalkalicoccus jeotgali B3]